MEVDALEGVVVLDELSMNCMSASVTGEKFSVDPLIGMRCCLYAVTSFLSRSPYMPLASVFIFFSSVFKTIKQGANGPLGSEK